MLTLGQMNDMLRIDALNEDVRGKSMEEAQRIADRYWAEFGALSARAINAIVATHRCRWAVVGYKLETLGDEVMIMADIGAVDTPDPYPEMSREDTLVLLALGAFLFAVAAFCISLFT